MTKKFLSFAAVGGIVFFTLALTGCGSAAKDANMLITFTNGSTLCAGEYLGESSGNPSMLKFKSDGDRLVFNSETILKAENSPEDCPS